MSSHHIIRENQEPALILWDIKEFQEHVFHALMEWSPLLLAREEFLPIINRDPINLDAFITTKTELSWKSVLAYQWPVEILDENDLKSIQNYLLHRNCTGVHIIGSPFQRPADEVLASLTNMEPVYYHGFYKSSYCRSGRFKKWMSVGRKLHIVFTGPKASSVNHSDTLQLLHKNEYECLREGLAQIYCSTPFWVQEIIN